MKSIQLLKRMASVLVGLALGASLLSAQERITVKGVVLDAEKQPVIGAAVLQAGTTNGAATDLDGNYTITVPAGATLEVSAIGYETLRVVGNDNEVAQERHVAQQKRRKHLDGQLRNLTPCHS